MAIIQNKIILSSNDKLKYYSFPIWIFGTFVFMTIINWNEYTQYPEKSTLLKISFLFFLIGSISLIIKSKNLKLFKLNHNWNHQELKSKLRLLSKKENWEIDTFDKEKIIFQTTRKYGGGKYFLTESRGEKIFIYYSNNEIKFKSILHCENNFGFPVSSGENKSNEQIVMNYLRPTANTA